MDLGFGDDLDFIASYSHNRIAALIQSTHRTSAARGYSNIYIVKHIITKLSVAYTTNHDFVTQLLLSRRGGRRSQRIVDGGGLLSDPHQQKTAILKNDPG